LVAAGPGMDLRGGKEDDIMAAYNWESVLKRADMAMCTDKVEMKAARTE